MSTMAGDKSDAANPGTVTIVMRCHQAIVYPTPSPTVAIESLAGIIRQKQTGSRRLVP